MLPKPPFPCDMSLDQELAIFEALKPRLIEVWSAIVTRGDSHITSVVVPSLTLDQEELKKLAGVAFYEERLLFLLIRLRNPRAHLVYVTSQPVHPLVLEYYLHLLSGVPASHARARLTMLCCYDASSRPLTQKILERPRLLQRIRQAIVDPSRAFLTIFNSTPLERRLSALLGIPLNGLDPALSYLGTKSGSRKVFREAGIDLPAGYEDLHSEEDVERALIELKRQRPGIRRAILKLNDSFSGEGNAVFNYPAGGDPGEVRRALEEVNAPVEDETLPDYFDRYRNMGGVVEEFIDASEKTSPSAQLRTSPAGSVLHISTHDQILGGASGQIYLGCRFPAADAYRRQIAEAGYRVGEVLARHGVVSRYGVDFLAWRNQPHEEWRITALEINLRSLGTTHPFLALSFLTGGQLNPESGLFISLGDRVKYYQATDNLRSDMYRCIIPEDLIDITTLHGLHYSPRTESGALFHLIGALSQFGKLGVTVIGNSPEEVDELYAQTLRVLDAESVQGMTPSGPQDRTF
jgi:hypothetical protein